MLDTPGKPSSLDILGKLSSLDTPGKPSSLDTPRKPSPLDTPAKLLNTTKDIIVISDKDTIFRSIVTLTLILITIVVNTTAHFRTFTS